jgi:hypothetical protein
MKQNRANPITALSLFLSIVGLMDCSYCLAASPGTFRDIDFSATPDGDFQGYSESGATFYAIDGVLTSTKFGNTPNGTRGIIGYDGDNAKRAVAAYFNPPVVEVSVELGDFNADADLLLLEAYDRGDGLIARKTKAISRTATSMFTLEVEGSAIYKIIFGSEGSFSNSVFADNIRYVPIPEPTSIVLVLSVVLAIATQRACYLTNR